ncbi:uncharacterized protein LOC110766803 isoform X2 [Prunus avium]|uniref:Uncharacterized protein LOC110766803 isoform X2 n=1 Tax=Prunus avium TaxID=42229 RepID=A0A6P5TEW7_PRUAV|nr:uncharacterized protein LOC110766803 isoform X2 [Prunus avium]
MDNVSSLECLKFDSQSEVLYKDGGGKDLLSPTMVPINFDTPITGSKVEIPKDGKLTYEECLTFSSFLWGPPIPPGECKFCLKVGEHYWSNCPYMVSVPKNAKVGSNCDVICKVCGLFFKKESCCGKDEGRAIPKVDRFAKHVSFDDGVRF